MAPLGEMPARGYYLAHEVGRLSGVSGKKIGQWARRGYIRSSRSEGRPRIYSFQDIAEAMVVHELVERHVPHREVRQTIRALREQYGYDWPLTNSTLSVTLAAPRPSGKKPAAWLLAHDGTRWVRPSKSKQQGLLEVDAVGIARDLERGGWIVREVPDLKHIEVDPDRLSGRPTIRGRRIAAEDVAELAQGPGGVDLLVDEYDLTRDQINDARRWWQVVQRYEAA